MDSEERRRLFAEQRERLQAKGERWARATLDAQPVREVSMTELHRDLCGIVTRVRTGEIAVVSKHRCAVAMIVPVVDESRLTARDPSTADGLEELSTEFARRARARSTSAYGHGRWYGKRYRRYRRRR